MQDQTVSAFPGEQFDVLAYFLYSDEATVSLGGYKFHPVVLFVVQPLHLMRAVGNYLTLAYLPVIGTESGLNGSR